MPEKQENIMDENKRFIVSENEENIRNDFTANYTAMVKMGQAAMWTALLVNAVMVVVSLFMINIALVGSGIIDKASVPMFIWSFWLSGMGCLTAMISFGVTYLSQESFFENYRQQFDDIRRAILTDTPYQMVESKAANKLQIIATLLVIFSYLFVIIGILIIGYALFYIFHIDLIMFFVVSAVIIMCILFLGYLVFIARK